MSNIDSKIDKLAEKMAGGREDHLVEVESMRKSLKKATLKKDLSQHPALRDLLSFLKKRESAYTTLLSNKPLDEKRVEWFARREEDRFLLSFFEVDRTLETLEKQVDYYLSDEIVETETEE